MMDFIRSTLNIVADGKWSSNEIIAMTIVLLVLIVLIFAIIKIVRTIIELLNPRKSTIFSHRKNKYKDRIGKKNKF